MPFRKTNVREEIKRAIKEDPECAKELQKILNQRNDNSNKEFFDKFIVIKREYIEDTAAQNQAELLCDYAQARRTIKTGKIDEPKYLVINIDEPYSEEIINILKNNGHWG